MSLGFHTGGQEKKGARAGAQSSPDLRVPSQLATPDRKPAAGKRHHLQPGLENSRLGAGSATRAPADADF